MEQSLLAVPQTLVGWIATLLFTGASMAYIFSRIRRNDMQILRDANADLRIFHEDNVKALTKMKEEIKILSIKVDILENKNRTLEDLVVVALKQFFFEHPDVANTVKKELKK